MNDTVIFISGAIFGMVLLIGVSALINKLLTKNMEDEEL
jgi:hypothetical protein